MDTPSEALTVSISEKAKVDFPFMAELTGLSEEEIYINILDKDAHSHIIQMK